MRIETKHGFSNERSGTADDAAHIRISVLHRIWELPALKRRAHALALRLGHAPLEHQELGASAHSSEQRLDEYVSFSGIGDELLANLSTSVADDPECSRNAHRSRQPSTSTGTRVPRSRTIAGEP